MNNNNLEFLTNELGSIFYMKWKKDTMLSLFIIAPLILSFLLICFIMIVGITLKLFLILLPPLILIVILFIYIPLFLRKKYINNQINFLSINDSIVSVETYKWFMFPPIIKSFKIEEIDFEESIDDSFFRGEKIYLIKAKEENLNKFYIINDFFDDIDILKGYFKVRN